MAAAPNGILALIDQHYSAVLTEWLDAQKRIGRAAADPERQAEATAQSKQFLDELRGCATSTTSDDITGAAWAPMRELLESVSRARALQGYSPTETATFVFSLKQPLFRLLQRELGRDADRFAEESWKATRLLDNLGLYTVEAYQKTREEIIARQQQELLELSTPVVQLVGGHSGAAADRHARQRAHADRDGEPAGADRGDAAPTSPSSTSPACPRSIRWSRSIC